MKSFFVKLRPALIVVPIMIFASCLAIEVYFVAEWWRLAKETKVVQAEGIQTTGTIVAIDEAGGGSSGGGRRSSVKYFPTVGFVDNSKTKRVFKGRYSIGKSWEVGQKIPLTYAASNPDIVFLDDGRNEIFSVANIVFMLVVLNFGVFLGGAGTIGMVQEIKKSLFPV